MKCPDCEREVEVGSPVTKGCDECLCIYHDARNQLMKNGVILPHLKPWVNKRLKELGKQVERQDHRRKQFRRFKSKEEQ